MAHAFVVYRSRLTTPPGQHSEVGLDSFGLVRMEGRWWIGSVTNDVVTPSRQPAERPATHRSNVTGVPSIPVYHGIIGGAAGAVGNPAVRALRPGPERS
jgi:hypothetical protein